MAEKLKTPELDKMLAVQDESSTLSSFWDWLAAEGYVLCKYEAPRERRIGCVACGSTGFDLEKMTARQRQLRDELHLTTTRTDHLKLTDAWPRCESCDGARTVYEEYVDEDSLYPVHEDPNEVFAKFFKIDYEEMRAERERVYQMVSEQANKRAA